ncbi:MAG: hypothetical protein IKJ09_11755 [Bacteroidaceae bacterium]|nr:hypothetical protein [Bacteroidaceae bacterium]
MIYKFRRDWIVIAVTVAVVLLTLSVSYLVYFVEGDMVDRIMVPIVFAVIYILALRTPRYFYIEKDLIIVKFFLGSKVLEEVSAVRPILKGELKGTSKSWGNGGLMGYTGHFENRYIGKFQMYAVNKKELALVTLANGKQYVINYPQELLENKQENRNFA